MKNILKITLAVITSFAIASSTFAGEFSVTGAAKMTYSVQSSESASGGNDGGKGIGIANEFSLGASGELENGYTWAYAQDIDGATVQDDAKMTLTTPYGTVGAFVSEGSISTKYANSFAVYGTGSDFGMSGGSTKHDAGADGAGFTYGDNVSNTNNLQYHTPAGLLPFDTAVKVAFAPSNSASANASSNSTDGTGSASSGTEDGDEAIQYSIATSPLDGLNLNASYYEKKKIAVAAGKVQTYETGSYGANYSIGNISVGYGKTLIAPSLAVLTTGTRVQDYENNMYSIGYAVNDALSVSYEIEKSDANKQTFAAAGNTDSSVEAEIQTIQAAYTAGGMTLSLSNKEIENMDYTTGKEAAETVFAVSMAF
jgi:hypothetical protein